MNQVNQTLSALGITLPDAPKPVASYVPAVLDGSLLYVSGQIPLVNGEVTAVGTVPSVVDPEAARAAARICAINALAVARDALEGDLDRIIRVVRLGVFVASDADFTDQPLVANGASDLMVEVFGDRGRHARAAVGASSLPLGVSVEVEMLLAVEPTAPRR